MFFIVDTDIFALPQTTAEEHYSAFFLQATNKKIIPQITIMKEQIVILIS